MGRWLGLGAWLLAAAPFGLVAVGARTLERRIASAIATDLRVAAAICDDPRQPPARAFAGDPPLGEHVPAALPRAERSTAHARSGSPGAPRPSAAGAHLAIGSDRLMELDAERLSAVRWAGVHDARGEASGVRLSGVAALGVGLADGDVVTSIDGRPTRTEHDATAAGIAAWTSGEPAAHATILRDEQVVAVTVELPRRGRRPVPGVLVGAGRD